MGHVEPEFLSEMLLYPNKSPTPSRDGTVNNKRINCSTCSHVQLWGLSLKKKKHKTPKKLKWQLDVGADGEAEKISVTQQLRLDQ